MKIAKKMMLAVVLSAPVLAYAAPAQAPFHHYDEQVFQKLDTNGDGKISRDEYRVFMEGAFEQLNTSKDGKLTRAQATPVLTDVQFDAIDRNRDGEVTQEEFITAVMSDFERQDRDGDGYLTR